MLGEPILTSVQQIPANGQVFSLCPFSFQCNFNTVNSLCSLVVTIERVTKDETLVVKSHAMSKNTGDSLVYEVDDALQTYDGRYICVVDARCEQKSPLFRGLLDSISADSPIVVLGMYELLPNVF